MATGAPTTQPRLPLWLKLVLSLAIVVGLGLVGLCVWDRAATARWYRYADKLRENGQPLTFAEIEAERTVIPAAQNGAKVIERLAVELSDLSKAASLDVFYFGGHTRHRDMFFRGVPRQHMEASRAFWRDHRALMVALEELESLPTGRFDTGVTPLNPLMMFIPEVSHVRQSSRLIRLDNAMRLIDGDMDGAAKGVRVHAHLAATLDEHPWVIGRLVQLAVERSLTNSIEVTLRVGQVDDRNLVRMQEDLEARLLRSSMRWGLVGERAFLAGVCESLATAKMTMGAYSRQTGGPRGLLTERLYPTFMIRQDQMRGAELLTNLIDATGDPRTLIQESQRLDIEAATISPLRITLIYTLASYSRAVTLHARGIAKLECARTALASERFRLENGRMPESLGELVPTYLPKIPIDPFDGQPLRLAALEEGIVIYSVNDNAVDDGGSIERPSNRGDSLDDGFRLFDPKHRGLLLIDIEED